MTLRTAGSMASDGKQATCSDGGAEGFVFIGPDLKCVGSISSLKEKHMGMEARLPRTPSGETKSKNAQIWKAAPGSHMHAPASLSVPARQQRLRCARALCRAPLAQRSADPVRIPWI